VDEAMAAPVVILSKRGLVESGIQATDRELIIHVTVELKYTWVLEFPVFCNYKAIKLPPGSE